MKITAIFSGMAIVLLVNCSSFQEVQSNVNDVSLNELPESTNTITEKYWKLIELKGQKVTISPGQEKEAHFVLHTEASKLAGYSGCNAFFGEYTLSEGNRIRFENLASTMRACPDLNVSEQELFQVFGMVDNYTIHNDTLQLNIGRRAPLAVFNAVYF
ncbi:META domain-containing protein [Reinekea sp.]|jgi:heat shock protein HslJ|uniref:META domain-containing protein n=1 Tax=Reinekea sp. TaxID=1970455 RepID=UPI003988EB79